MPTNCNKRSAKIVIALAIAGSACLAASSPAQAAIVDIDTFSNSADAASPTPDAIFGTGSPGSGLSISASTFTFQDSGIQVTFSNPQAATDAVSRTNSTLGTCIGGNRPATSAVCGNAPTPLPQLDSITLTFNQAVQLISTSGVLRSVTENYNGDNKVTSFWQTLGSSASFDYTNPPNVGGSGFYANAYSSNFTNFLVNANTPVTITSTFTEGYMDYWMQNLRVQSVTVPGPLPILGAGSAFAFTRRIRRRINAARRIELV